MLGGDHTGAHQRGADSEQRSAEASPGEQRERVRTHRRTHEQAGERQQGEHNRGGFGPGECGVGGGAVASGVVDVVARGGNQARQRYSSTGRQCEQRGDAGELVRLGRKWCAGGDVVDEVCDVAGDLARCVFGGAL